MRDEVAYVELQKLIAMLGDGHTNVWRGDPPKLPPASEYPINIIWFKEGLYVAALPKEQARYLGHRLVSVADLPVEQAIDRVIATVPVDNATDRLGKATRQLADAWVLHVAGVAPLPSAARWTVADESGAELTFELTPVVEPPDLQTLPPKGAGLHTMRSRETWFGHEIMADGTMFVWYDRCSNARDKTVATFARETLAALDSALAASPPTVRRVVVDLRRNGGGNSALVHPLIDGLESRKHCLETQGLRALIGRRTYSSAMRNAHELRIAGAILFGEPTGGSPHGYGELQSFILPNTGIWVWYSTKRFDYGPRGADAIVPDVPIALSKDDYFAGRDAAFEAAARPR